MKHISAVLIGILMVLPAVSSAQTTNPDKADLLAQIASLQAQLDKLLIIVNAEQDFSEATTSLSARIPIGTTTNAASVEILQTVTPSVMMVPVPGRSDCFYDREPYVIGIPHYAGIECGG